MTNAIVSTEKKRKFREECQSFIVHLLLKQQERAPIQYALVRNSFSLVSQRFVRLADLLYSLKFISSSVADNAKFQYDQFIKKEVVKEKDIYLSCNMDKVILKGDSVLTKKCQMLKCRECPYQSKIGIRSLVTK